MDFIPLSSNPNDLAQLEADKLRYQQRQQLAQSLMGAQYVPNSGGMGVLTSALSSLAGAFVNRRNNESLTDLMRREFETQNKAAVAKRQQEQADEERKFNRELQKIGYGEKAKRDYALPQLKDGMVQDPTTGEWHASKEYADQQLAMKRAEAAISAANRQDPNAGLMAKIALAQKMGADPQAIMAMVTGQQGAPDTQVVGNNLVDKRTGKAMPIMGPDGKPIEAGKSSDEQKADASNKAMAQDAIAFAAAVTGKRPEEISAMPPAKVRELVANNSRFFSGPIMGKVPFTGYDLNAYSNSAAGKQARINNPTGPVSNADFDVAAKSIFSQEKPPEVNADLIYNALSRAQGQQQGAQDQPPQAQPTQTAVNPKTGQRIGLVNGQWVPL